MNDLTAFLTKSMDIGTINDIASYLEAKKSDHQAIERVSLLARCYLKLGNWQKAVNEDSNQDITPEILRSFLAATHCDKSWYKAWHAWSLSNFEVIAAYEKSHETVSPQILISHAVPSIQGFIRSIALSKGNSLQDTLRLLTLWFKYGYQPEVTSAILEAFSTVSIDTWLSVIPQLIARIHTNNASIRKLVHQLLIEIGKHHPQALVYPITVASKSQSTARKKAATYIIDKMRMHSSELLEQVGYFDSPNHH